MPRKPRGWEVWTERSGKVWRCRWRGKYGTGENTFIFKKDAQDLTATTKQEFQQLDAGLPIAPRVQRAMTLGKFADEYLAYSLKEKGAKTHKNFNKPAVTSLVAYLGENTLLSSIQPADIQRWKHTLPGETTARMRFTSARTFFNYAVDMEYLPKSPAKKISKPLAGPGGRALTDEEIELLLGNAPEALYRSGVFSLNTMLRIEEVCMFDWSWVTRLPDGNWMGRVPWELRKSRSKVKKDCIFPLNAAARAVMGDRRESGRVFPWKAVTLQHQIIKTRRNKKLKLADDITFHCFRHTGATRYLRNGHLEDLLKTRIWSDPRSLLGYIHVDPQVLIPRFAALQFGDLPPIGPQNAKTRRLVSETGGS